MRTRYLVLLLAMIALICGLLSPALVSAEKIINSFGSRVHTIEFSKSVPGQLNYQGFLANTPDSSAVTATLEMTFRLFDSETKGAELWAETHPAVEVQGGLFQVLLGSVTPFPDGLFDGSGRWLQTEVGSEILSPRKPLVSVAYSHRTNSAEMLMDNTLTDLDNRWVNEADLDHLDAADGDPGDAVHVDDDGKVGIGTTSPLTELDVNGSVNAATYYGDGSNLTGISGTADNDWTIRGDTVYHQTGLVGIGTSDPEMLLDVYGGMARLTWGLIVGKTSTGVPGIHIYDDDVGPSIRFTNASGMDSRSSINFMDTTGALWTIDNDIYGNHGQNFGIKDDRAIEYRVFIDSAGQVGIGTISPAHELDVNGSVNAATYYGDGSNLTGISGTTDNDWTISGNDIYSTLPGNVGIGTASPAEKLAVSGNIRASGTIQSGSSITIDGSNDRISSSDDLDLQVSSGRALRLESHATSPNLIGGYSGNNVTPGVYGATIGGGGNSGSINSVTGNYSTVAGGHGNTASSDRALVGGGQDNTASSSFTTVGGGWLDQASLSYAAVCGGSNNAASGSEAFVGGGSGNTAGAQAATVGGGQNNQAIAQGATIGGGEGNAATDEYATVGGGQDNTAEALYATVGGGYTNRALGHHATVGGGYNNYASGHYSTIPGGSSNYALGRYSFAAGRRAQANHPGCFVWADSTDVDFSSSIDNEFKVRASNGMTVFSSNSYYGMYIDNQTGDGDGIRSYTNVSNGTNWGALYAVNSGTSPAVYASATTAGYFSGNVTVTGTMSKGGGSFKIDHPLDPENKYLYHSFVESPDMMNIYNGNVILDARGQAWVKLPDWFGPLNRDFRYQLTAVGAPGPNLYVAEKISGNRFKIAGGKPGMEVSWQVTGIRQDAFANAHRIPVEEEKPENERGNYLHPREHGMPETAGINHQARLRKESK